MEIIANYFDIALNYLVIFIEKIGYLGIFIGMLLEGSFIPIPSEIIMVPAGVSASQGNMNIYAVIAAGTIGCLTGSLLNYFIAISLGRSLLIKFGKYFFISEKTIIKMEEYFIKHGAISTFIGRLIPLVRQYISLPAGIAKMKLSTFCIYTTAGSLIWSTILVYLGFFIGENQELVKEYLHNIIMMSLLFCILLTITYVAFNKRKMLKAKG